MSQPGPEAEFYSRIYQLSRACESLDVDRIAAFYAPEATSSTPGQPLRDDRGLPAIRATLERQLGQVRTIHVSLTNVVQVRPSSRRIVTTQGFRAEWTTRDGTGMAWDGRHVATWENRSGVLLIVQEELLDPPVVTAASSAVLPVLGQAMPPLQAPGPTPAPPVTTVPPAPSPTPEPAARTAEVPAPLPEPVRPAPGASSPPAPSGSLPVPAPSRAATFSTPDWNGGPVFVIHFGSFTDQKRAQAHAAALARSTGLPSRAVRVDLGEKGTWVRSVVGEFRTLEEALASRARLVAEGVPSIGLVYRMTSRPRTS